MRRRRLDYAGRNEAKNIFISLENIAFFWAINAILNYFLLVHLSYNSTCADSQNLHMNMY